MAKTVNYTPEMVSLMTDMYNSVASASESERDAMVSEIADTLGKKERSVRQKLSSLGVYIAKTPVAKDGKPAVRKATLAQELSDLTELPLVSADNLNKVDLVALIDYIQELKQMVLELRKIIITKQ